MYKIELACSYRKNSFHFCSCNFTSDNYKIQNSLWLSL